jgi:hypothetical protein
MASIRSILFSFVIIFGKPKARGPPSVYQKQRKKNRESPDKTRLSPINSKTGIRTNQ